MADLREMIQALTPEVPLPQINTATGVNGIDAAGNVWVYTPPTVKEFQAEGAPFLSLSGGTMLGPLILANATPTQPLEAASKSYVDGILNNANLTGIPTAPTALPAVSNSQIATTAFVHAAIAAGGEFVDAPADGTTYGRLNHNWSGVLPLVGSQLTATGAITSRQLTDHFADRIYAKDFGAVFDGTSHPLSQFYPNLAAAQAVYPRATALTNEIDGIATQTAIDVCVARSAPGLPAPYMGGGTVVLPAGAGLMNTPLLINGSCVNLVVDGAWMGGSRSNLAFNAYSMPCRLRWNGPGVTAGAPVQYMLTMQPTDGGRVVACSNVIGVLFDCNAVAGVAGVLVASVRASRLALNVREPRGVLYPGATLVAGSQTITMTSTAALAVGQSVSSPSLPAGAYIAAIPSGTTIQASAQASASNTETVCVGGEGMRMDVVDAINDSNDTQYNSVEYACTTELAAAHTCGPCLMLGGSGLLGGPPGHFGNTSVNHFNGIRTISSNNPHIVINNTDHNIFDIVSIQNVTGPAGALGLVLNGSLNPNNGGARYNMFQYVIGGMVNAVGTDTGGFTQGSINNVCYILDTANGSGIFRVGTGATLSAATDRYPTLMQPLGGNLGVVASFPDQTVLGGGNRGFYSVDLQTDRSSPAQVASGTDSVVLGGQNNSALTQFSAVVGGQGNTASVGVAPAVVGGTNNQATGGGAFVGGGLNNVSSNTQTTVAGGQNNQASAVQATVGGGISNVASGGQSVVAGGSNNTAAGLCSTVVGGISNQAPQPYATAIGNAATADLYGAVALSSGLISSGRRAQTYIQMLSGITGAGTAPVRLTADQGPAGAVNVCNLTWGSEAVALRVQLVASDSSGANNRIAWTQPLGLIRRNGGLASIVYIPGTPVSVTEGVTAGFAVTEAADIVNGGYNLSFTPPTGNAVAWRVTATVEMTRVDFI